MSVKRHEAKVIKRNVYDIAVRAVNVTTATTGMRMRSETLSV